MDGNSNQGQTPIHTPSEEVPMQSDQITSSTSQYDPSLKDVADAGGIQGAQLAMPSPACDAEQELHVPSSPTFRPHMLDTELATAFLSQVQLTQPHVFDDLSTIITEYKLQRIDAIECICRVTFLLNDHPELIVGFNNLLPPVLQMELKLSSEE